MQAYRQKVSSNNLAEMIEGGFDPIWEEVFDDYGVYQVLDKKDGYVLVTPIDSEEDEEGTLSGEWMSTEDLSVR